MELERFAVGTEAMIAFPQGFFRVVPTLKHQMRLQQIATF